MEGKSETITKEHNPSPKVKILSVKWYKNENTNHEFTG